MGKKTIYQSPSVTVDVVIFTIQDEDLKVLLINRSNDPFKNWLALPGGFLTKNEQSKDAASRILKNKAGVEDVYIEQLYTFDDIKRDPRGHILSIAYFALVPKSDLRVESDQGEHPKLFSVKKLPHLAFDHKKIINYALSRLRAKLEYTNAVYSLLPKEFTMFQLRKTYEIILDKDIDKRNFIKKFLSLKIIKSLPRKIGGPRRRPAQLYCFISKKLTELVKFF